MTFASDTARFLFHQLPTAKQMEYAKLEDQLAERCQQLQVEAVMQFNSVLEIVIRITDNDGTV